MRGWPAGGVSSAGRPRAWLVTLVAGAVLVTVPATGRLAGATAAEPLTTAATPSSADAFTEVWRDDFGGAAGAAVDSSSWMHITGTSYPGGAANFGTGEVETMTSSTANSATDGKGHLAITPLRDSAGRWTSARLETRRTDFAAPAGGVLRVEASIQQPDVTTTNGIGYWPAFWMLGAAARPVGATNWPGIGEVDILEDVNGRSSVFGTLHCGVVSGGPCNETTGLGSGERACSGCQTGFHSYAVELDRSTSPERIRWSLDGSVYFTVTADQVDSTTWANAVHHGFFLILNVAMGGGFPAAFGGGAPTSATVSGRPMLVDRVSVAVRNPGGQTGTSSPAPSSSTSPSPGASSTIGPGPGDSGGQRDAFSLLQAESSDLRSSGVSVQACTDTDGGSYLGKLSNGHWVTFRGVRFGSAATQFLARVASGAGTGVSGLVEVRLDSRTSTPVGSLSVANTGGWDSWRTIPANLTAVTGTHDVHLMFRSGQSAPFVNLNWVSFGP